MKKIFNIMMVCFATVISLTAQTPVKQRIKVTEQQVPLVVKQAYEKEFGSPSNKGFWVAYIEKHTESGKITAKPIWYSYHHRDGGKKVEVRYNPEGIITFAKGVEESPTKSSRNTSIDKKKKIG